MCRGPRGIHFLQSFLGHWRDFSNLHGFVSTDLETVPDPRANLLFFGFPQFLPFLGVQRFAMFFTWIVAPLPPQHSWIRIYPHQCSADAVEKDGCAAFFLFSSLTSLRPRL